MRDDPPTTTQQVVLTAWERRWDNDSGPGTGDPFEDASPSRHAYLLLRYSLVRSASSSPLRDDLDLCLAELDELIAFACTESQTYLTYLHFEMEERRRMVIQALQSGFEV